MASPLTVSFIIKAVDQASAQLRKVTNNFSAMKRAKATADRAFRSAANIRQAAEGVNTFARHARAAVAAPVESFADFEAAMSGVKAVTGKMTDNEFAEITAAAKELGATTRFTAVQAAEGFKFFGIAGWEAAESMKALPAAMNLSVASGTELGRTADILSDVMGAYGMEATEASHASDVLAYTISSSNTTMETLFESMKVAAPVAKNLGVGIEDLSAMIGIMGSAGIKGSLAGTALRSSMLKLSAPSSRARGILQHFGIAVMDGQKNLRPMIDILADMSEKMKGAGTAVRATVLKELTGLRAVSGINVLLDKGADEIRKFGENARAAGGRAAEMAKIMDNNLKGKSVLLTSAIDGLKTAIGEQLAPAISAVTGWVTLAAQAVTKWVTAHPKLTKAIGVVAAVVAVFSTILAGLMFTAAAVLSAFGGLAFAFGITATAAAAAAAPFIAIGAVVAAVIGTVALAIVYWDEIKMAFDRFRNASLKTKIVLGLLFSPLIALLSPFIAIGYAANAIIDNWEPIKEFFVDLFTTIIGHAKQFIGLVKNIPLVGGFVDMNVSAVKAVAGVVKDTAVDVARDTRFIATGSPDLQTSEYMARTEESSMMNGRSQLSIKVDSEGRASIIDAESDGLDMDIETWFNGQQMAGATG